MPSQKLHAKLGIVPRVSATSAASTKCSSSRRRRWLLLFSTVTSGFSRSFRGHNAPPPPPLRQENSHLLRNRLPTYRAGIDCLCAFATGHRVFARQETHLATVIQADRAFGLILSTIGTETLFPCTPTGVRELLFYLDESLVFGIDHLSRE